MAGVHDQVLFEVAVPPDRRLFGMSYVAVAHDQWLFGEHFVATVHDRFFLR